MAVGVLGVLTAHLSSSFPQVSGIVSRQFLPTPIDVLSRFVLALDRHPADAG